MDVKSACLRDAFQGLAVRDEPGNNAASLLRSQNVTDDPSEFGFVGNSD